LSDVQLYEEYPSTYVADMSRRHRWIRGDWQLAGWLFSRVPGTGPRRVSNPLSALSQWKLLDNLRRSLVPPALTLLLLLGWTVLPYAPLWTLVVLTVVLLPWVCAVILEAWSKPEEASPQQHLATTTAVAGRNASQTLLTLAFLPYEAIVNLDAIVRTSWRMLVTRRRLLEWNPWAMEDPDRRTATVHRRNGLFTSVGSMWFAPAIAVTLGVLLAASARPPRRPRRRSSSAGSSRRRSRGGSANPLRVARPTSPPATSHSCASLRAARGHSSKRSWARTTGGCRRTTSRSTRWWWLRIARRRRTSGSRCSPTSPHTTSASSRPAS
jgi:hypothetical protein